jgi:hypothetical protein
MAQLSIAVGINLSRATYCPTLERCLQMLEGLDQGRIRHEIEADRLGAFIQASKRFGWKICAALGRLRF